MTNSRKNLEGSKNKRKSRGREKGLKRKPNVIRELKWDVLNRPCGTWVNDFASHIGTVTRAKVSCTFRDWTLVPNGLKETIWLDIQREFRIPNDRAKKAAVIARCNEAWKRCKYILKRDYVDRKPGPNAKMPYEDGQVSIEEWNVFVNWVTSKEFKIMSEKGKASRACNLYPHYMGRTPYVEKENGWKEEGLYSSLSTTSTTTVCSLLPRTVNWMEARKKKDDKGNQIVPNEKTKEAIENIEMWEEKAKKGEFTPHRTNDPLNRGLDRKEHNGRALGYGGKRTITDVYGSCHKSSSSRADKENEDLKVQRLVRKELAAALAGYAFIPKESEFQDVDVAAPVDNMPHPKSSCQSGGVAGIPDLQSEEMQQINKLKEITECRLAMLIEGHRVIVAYGRVFPQMTATHFKSVNIETVAVNIDDVVVKYAYVEVPVPTDDIIILGDAKRSFTQWPKKLVILDDKAISPEGNATNESVACLGVQMGQNSKGNESVACVRKTFHSHNALPPKLSQKCRSLKSMLDGYDTGDSFEFKLEKSIFCHSEDSEVMIVKEDVVEMLTGAWLDTSVIEFFMIALRSQYHDMFGSIGLMCPTSISSASLESQQRKDESTAYMIHVLKEYKSKCFIFCPSFENHHWVLLVICMGENEVYSFDSCSTTNVANTAFRTLLNRLGI